MLLLKLFECSIRSAQDSDKVKSNAVRALGNFLRYLPGRSYGKEHIIGVFDKVEMYNSNAWADFVMIFFSCDQAALWMVQSVRLSVRPSVCHTFLTMFPSSYHHGIFRSYYQWQKWRPCKRSRSKVKVTEVTTQLNRFRTVTPVWIHIWWWNDAYSLTMLRRGALLFLKVIRQISRSHGSKNRRIWPRLGVSGL